MNIKIIATLILFASTTQAAQLFVTASLSNTVTVIDTNKQIAAQTISGVGLQPFDLMFDNPRP